MQTNEISFEGIPKDACLRLDGSKSISNRALLIQALSGHDFALPGLSTAEDVQSMQLALNTHSNKIDVGPAGTTFRFLCALLSLQEGRETMLTGSARMLERPIGPLVNGLRQLGADIEYIGQSGYPPLRIKGTQVPGGEVTIQADISSQFISALMMIGPVLSKGVEIELTGELVSYSYLQLTKSIMLHFGAEIAEYQNERGHLCFKVNPKSYEAKDLQVEADWSAASYYYALVALSNPGNSITLEGLQEQSFQGDSALVEMGPAFGIESQFTEQGLLISKTAVAKQQLLDWDYSNCPDIAQTTAVICAGLGLPARFTGVQTLKRKETDRTAALATELGKLGVRFYEEGSAWLLDPSKADFSQPVEIDTYHDHRMAMSFAPLAIKLPSILIRDPKVVGKSYPHFWTDLEKIGFTIKTKT